MDIPKRPDSRLLLAVAPADLVVARSRPCRHRSGSGRLLLGGTAERDPVAVLPEPSLEVIETALEIGESGLPDRANQRRWTRVWSRWLEWVAVPAASPAARARREFPLLGFRSLPGHTSRIRN